ncbi:MAG TPA: hypothetical protein VNB23_06225 [Ramlibacter sp.]|nr:hypothetical protein [Ramlibacter sp.]
MTIAKTAAGLQVLKDRSVALTPRQRTALIMVDGKLSLEELLVQTAAAGATRADVERLMELGLVEVRASAATATTAPRAPVAAGPISPDRYLAAYQAAVRLTAELGLKGMRLNMAVESAANHEQLVALLPKLRAVLKPEKYAELEALLGQ